MRTITGPSDLKRLSPSQVDRLAQEIRRLPPEAIAALWRTLDAMAPPAGR